MVKFVHAYQKIRCIMISHQIKHLQCHFQNQHAKEGMHQTKRAQIHKTKMLNDTV